jgi:hypothetical protein
MSTARKLSESEYQVSHGLWQETIHPTQLHKICSVECKLSESEYQVSHGLWQETIHPTQLHKICSVECKLSESEYQVSGCGDHLPILHSIHEWCHGPCVWKGGGDRCMKR